MHMLTLNCCCCHHPQRLKEQRERRSESLAKKRAMRMASQASKE
jgi:hypothetical protein